MKRLTPKQRVLRKYPTAVCRQGYFAARRFHIFPESYQNGWTGNLMASGNWIGTALSATAAWADAARRLNA